MRSLAIIPARGGSKRIPKKNIKCFLGVPMIVHSIRVAKECKLFERVIVSTDSEEIAKIALEYGAEVPFLRPSNIADDYATTLDVIAHAIHELHGRYDAVCCIYATAPFITVTDLKQSQQLLNDKGIDYAFSAVKYSYPIQRSFRLLGDGSVEMFYPNNYDTRSQDLEDTFHDAGQFYWGREKAFLNCKPIFSTSSKVHILPEYRVQDIDTEEDWVRTEMMYEVWKKMGCP